MMTADPRAVKAAVPVPCVSYEEAAELAYFGANILHPVSSKSKPKILQICSAVNGEEKNVYL